MKKFTIIILALAFMIGVMATSVSLANERVEEAVTGEAVYVATYKQGSTGQTVKTIQQKLKNWGYYKGAVDGIFGAKTREAVKYFQRRNGLTVDGIVGNKTLRALGMPTTTTATTGNGNYTNSDLTLLARLISGEARGESYTGKVAVGAVVLNRVKSSSFPNTISGVIYQPYAFTAVSDGQINVPPDNSCYEAAKAAMNGWDPTYGAIYYYNPSTATSKWIFSRKTTVTIGKHVFAV